MGNPNLLWWRWGRAQSGVQQTTVNPPQKFIGYGRTNVGGHGIVSGGKGADIIEIHELRMREVGNGFPNAFPPHMQVEFQINDLTYFSVFWASRRIDPFLVDLSVTNSNTTTAEAPLRVSGGETMRILMTDGVRASNSDTYGIEVDLWGIKL